MANIYEFKNNDGQEWVAALTKREAVEYYKLINTMTADDIEEFTISRLAKVKWKDYTVIDDDNFTPPLSRTFEEWMDQEFRGDSEMIVKIITLS